MSGIESPLVRGYRELLRVGRDASQEEIKRAFRAMARVYHPDQNPDPQAAVVFIRIREAYDALSDPASLAKLNREYVAGKWAEPCLDGSDLNSGVFFGHRFARGRRRRSVEPEDFPWWEGPPPLVIDEQGNASYSTRSESSVSILDDPSLDLVEVVFAGRFDGADEQRLYEAFRARDFESVPWFVLNNEGIVHFLERRYEAALSCYEALNRRIPDNIVFLFRLGVCHQVIAFERRWRVPPFGDVMNRRHVKAAIRCYERAIQIGESRPFAPQRCMTIRKTLADLLAASGRRWRAHECWRRIGFIEPGSQEAQQRLEETKPRIAGFLTAGR